MAGYEVYFPVAQFVQEERSEAEIVPAMHCVHVSLPEREKYPEAHVVQDEAPVDEYLPAAQLVHVDDPIDEARVPTAQEVHDTAVAAL